MARERIIKPDVINILCRDPQPSRRVSYEPMPMPEPKPEPPKTFWGKVGEFFQTVGGALKKAAWFATPIVALMGGAAALVNAVTRYRDVDYKISDEKPDEKPGKVSRKPKKKSRKSSRPYNIPAGVWA